MTKLWEHNISLFLIYVIDLYNFVNKPIVGANGGRTVLNSFFSNETYKKCII